MLGPSGGLTGASPPTSVSCLCLMPAFLAGGSGAFGGWEVDGGPGVGFSSPGGPPATEQEAQRILHRKVAQERHEISACRAPWPPCSQRRRLLPAHPQGLLLCVSPPYQLPALWAERAFPWLVVSPDSTSCRLRASPGLVDTSQGTQEPAFSSKPTGQ